MALGSPQWMYSAGKVDELPISQSCMFEDADSAYLHRTQSSAGNRRAWTYSVWVKRGSNFGTTTALLGAYVSGSVRDVIRFTTDNRLEVQVIGSGFTMVDKYTVAQFNDPSAWYHFVIVWDSANSTAADRTIIYVNGVRQTLTGTDSAQNVDTTWNNNAINYIGARSGDGTPVLFWDGYMAEINFLDGVVAEAEDFGRTGDTYGDWIAIEYEGSYGTNGYSMKFNSSGNLGLTGTGGNTDVGANFTSVNLSADSQVLDTPTNNFCTLNPNAGGGGTISKGNLYLTHTADPSRATGTIGVNTGKWYWEVLQQRGKQLTAGWGPDGTTSITGYTGYGRFYVNNSNNGSSIATTDNGDIMGIAVDFDANSFTVYKNGSSQGSNTAMTFSTTEYYLPKFYVDNNAPPANFICNFGQDSSFAGLKTSQGNQDDNSIGDFHYDVPAGFLALCTSNLPESAVIPSRHFSTTLYTGNGTTGQSITGVGFQSDFLWAKARASTTGSSHRLFDSVRGVSKQLRSNTTGAEGTDTELTSFDPNGFTIDDDGDGSLNDNNIAYVAWNWKGNSSGTAVAESGAGDNGYNACTHYANQGAGFSIVKYTGRNSDISNGEETRVTHGLGVVPELIIIKNRDSSEGWAVQQDDNWNDSHLRLDTNAANSGALYTGNHLGYPTNSSYFVVGNEDMVNKNDEEYIAYVWKSIDGYSKTGVYSGNGSTSSNFVYTGFRPAYILIKRFNASGEWWIKDSARDPINGTSDYMRADGSNTESAGWGSGSNGGNLNFLSNGFQWTGNYASMNASGGAYFYLAFAETPFKHANAK